MSWPARERWIILWNTSNASGNPLVCYEELKTAYGFDTARHLAQRSEEVEMAIWFHDAVYNPKASDNEEKSVAFANRSFAGATILTEFAERVGQLIMATKTHEANSGSDAALLTDIDLSILGQPEKRFDEYESQIRQEYAWVPEPVYRVERAKILRKFLARKRVFATEWFQKKYEDAARQNLQSSVKKLT